MNKEELAKLERFLRKTFGSAAIRVVPRPKLKDSAEVYVGEEFIGTMTLDDEEGERAFQFQMAILSEDLDD